MALLNQTTNYFSDMAVVDERLKRLERAYEEISKLLTALSMDIKLIMKGDENNGKCTSANEGTLRK